MAFLLSIAVDNRQAEFLGALEVPENVVASVTSGNRISWVPPSADAGSQVLNLARLCPPPDALMVSTDGEDVDWDAVDRLKNWKGEHWGTNVPLIARVDYKLGTLFVLGFWDSVGDLELEELRKGLFHCIGLLSRAASTDARVIYYQEDEEIAGRVDVNAAGMVIMDARYEHDHPEYSELQSTLLTRWEEVVFTHWG